MNRHTRLFLLAGAVTLALFFPAMVVFMTLFFTNDVGITLEMASRVRVQIIAGFAAMFIVLFLTLGAAPSWMRSGTR